MTITSSQIRENLMMGLTTMRTHKFRSFLTILGVVIGVTSVTAVASIIQGLNNVISDRVELLGSKVFFVSRMTFQFGRIPENIRKRKFLEYEDAAAIRENCPHVEMATVILTRAAMMGQSSTIKYQNESLNNPIIRGAEANYDEILPAFSVEEGRFLTDYEDTHAQNVCIIGQKVKDSLFPHTDPIGQEVTLDERRLRVIGVFEKDPGMFGGPSVDDFVVLPYRTFHKFWPENKDNAIIMTVRDPLESGIAQDEVVEVLRRRRRVPPREENDFEITSPEFLMSLWEQLTGAVVILTMVISSISLLVGGIGVMNILLVSVTERTKEIGIRKALGARRRDIVTQFLLEAMIMTGTGGTLGIVVGISSAMIIRWIFPALPATVSVLWMTIAFLMSLAVGLFFGIMPAAKAARLDPVQAMRHE